MTTRYIEYYEVRGEILGAPDALEYYYMPMDDDAKNKEDLDHNAVRVWRLDTKRDTVVEIHTNGTPNKPLSKIQLLKIQLVAKPVPYDYYYLMRQKRLQRNAGKNK
jgi:hypothetical protein